MTEREFVKKQRNKVFNLKMGLEKTMIVDLKNYFAEQKRNVRAGKDIDTIAPVLQKHYLRIVRTLTGKQIKQNIPQEVIDFIANKADIQANEIDDTTRKEIEQSIELARQSLQDEGITDYTQETLLLIASKIFIRKSKWRIRTVSNTETQENAEGIRNILALAGLKELETAIAENDITKISEIYQEKPSYTAYKVRQLIGVEEAAVLFAFIASAKKEWETMGDSKVRIKPFNHQAANGQQVGITEPFIVSGQLLKYPGDMSLGASIGNVVNCRCLSVYL